MIKNLTIHIVIRNNIKTIEKCLKSIEQLNSEILVADIGNNDGTIEICQKYDAKIKRISHNEDMSFVRNFLISETKTDWIMCIQPWEILVSGADKIIEKVLKDEKNAYKFNIIQNDILIKDIRIWNKNMNLKYKNPIYECLYGDFDVLPVYLKSENNTKINEKDIKRWIENSPLSTSAVYYMSCYYLTEKKWDSFINFAEMYLHQEKNIEVSYYMINYYLSMVLSYIKKDYQKANKHLMICLAKMPTMAEFWCLYGDIFFALKDYDRAISMYENAEIMGRKRMKNDDFPIEISKYKEYPLRMIDNCQKIISSKKVYGTDGVFTSS